MRNFAFESELSGGQNSFFTAKSRETEIAKGLALGADDYITKPYSNAELVAKIKDLLETTPKESRDKF